MIDERDSNPCLIWAVTLSLAIIRQSLVRKKVNVWKLTECSTNLICFNKDYWLKKGHPWHLTLPFITFRAVEILLSRSNFQLYFCHAGMFAIIKF